MVEDKAKVRFSRQWSNHSLSGVVSASARSSMQEQEAGSRIFFSGGRKWRRANQCNPSLYSSAILYHRSWGSGS